MGGPQRLMTLPNAVASVKADKAKAVVRTGED